MGLLEAQSEKINLIRQVQQQEKGLYEAMTNLQIFSGTKEELEAAQGMEYEWVKLSDGSTYVEGGVLRFSTLFDDPKPRQTRFDWRRMQAVIPGFYRQIRAQAVKVGADTIVEHRETISWLNVHESGRLVRRLHPNPEENPS